MPFVFNEIPVKQLLFAVTGALDIADEYFRMPRSGFCLPVCGSAKN